MPDEEAKQASEQYKKWKQLTPFLYDWFANHNLTWPSLSCRWGGVLEEHKRKTKQLLYLSEQTDGSEPNKLLIMTCDLAKPRVASAETLRDFNEAAKSPLMKRYKTIHHPGEVNKIREVPQHQNIIVTHTDAPELYVWSLDNQPNRFDDKGAAFKEVSVADLVLTGHEDDAEFALGVSSAAPYVASGGKDTNVLLWNLADQVTSLSRRPEPPSENGTQATKAGPKLAAQTTLKGHSNTVEDVVFAPASTAELASVGDDRALLFWDTRAGTAPALRVADAHGAQDLHTVDWSTLDANLLATGAADGSLKVWDRRQLGSGGSNGAAHTFRLHTEAMVRVEWCPHRAGMLASSSEDRIVYVWDLHQTAAPAAAPDAAAPKRHRSNQPPELLFTHAGHRASVVDFQWNPADPWTIMSVSDDVGTAGGGGTLQVWRINDFIYRPEAEVLAELESHRQFILTGVKPEAKPAASAPEAEPSSTAAAEDTPASAAEGTAGPLGTPSSVEPPATEATDVATDSALPVQGDGAAAVTTNGGSGTTADIAKAEPMQVDAT